LNFFSSPKIYKFSYNTLSSQSYFGSRGIAKHPARGLFRVNTRKGISPPPPGGEGKKNKKKWKKNNSKNGGVK